MMEPEKELIGCCPACGKQLHIPGGLTEFSCLYCGTRLTPEDIQPKPRVQAPDAEYAYTQLEEDLAGTILSWPGVFRKLTRKEFGPHFSAYVDANRPLFSRLPAALSLDPEAGTRLAQAVITQLENSSKNTMQLDDAKYTLCLLFIPAVRSLGLDGAEEFCAELHRIWMERHARSPFQLVTYEEIDAGFQRKKLCFITTAVCGSLGKEDDCMELTAFRSFRDNYLMSQPDGEKLVKLYYDIAPGIVTAIDCAEDSPAVYKAIWQDYLDPCYRDIRTGNPEHCKAVYTQMVQALSQRYLRRALSEEYSFS